MNWHTLFKEGILFNRFWFDTGKGVVLFLIVVAFSVDTNAQKQTSHVQQTWFAYFNQARLSDKWGLWIDGHLRTDEKFFNNLSQGIARVGLTYYLNDNTKLTAGYGYVHHFPNEGHEEIARPEHRPWQQIQWHTKYNKLRMMQYLRLEERYRRKLGNDHELGEGYNFNYRMRYNMFLSAPLHKEANSPRSLSVIVNDEVHLNFGKEIVNNYFDQNRFFAGFAYYLNAHDNIQFGYMNVFQQLPAGNKYRNMHILRLFYIQNIDLRKSKN
jgi:hypothetical protein